MQSSAGCAPGGGHRSYTCWFRFALVLTLGLLVAGCVGGSGGSGRSSSLTPRVTPPATIAFESIDGPPPEIFRRLVQKLSEEAEARNVPIVSREGQAPYRIRGYVALGIHKKQKRAVVTWVWDVYDASQQRTVRFSGEEPAGAPRQDGWALANDEVLTRVARAGMERLAVYLQVPEQSAPPPAEPRDAAEREVVASHDDFRPEAHGIFRIFRSEPAPSEPAPAPASAVAELPTDEAIPLPRRRPAERARRSGAMAQVTPSPRVHND